MRHLMICVLVLVLAGFLSGCEKKKPEADVGSPNTKSGLDEKRIPVPKDEWKESGQNNPAAAEEEKEVPKDSGIEPREDSGTDDPADEREQPEARDEANAEDEPEPVDDQIY